MHLPTPSRRRRLVMPLLIAMAAVVVMYWSSKRDARFAAQIQRHIETLCDDASFGRPIADRLNNPNSLVAAQTEVAIKEAWTPASTTREVVVVAGDIAHVGDGTATHTAM